MIPYILESCDAASSESFKQCFVRSLQWPYSVAKGEKKKLHKVEVRRDQGVRERQSPYIVIHVEIKHIEILF